jgi:hypothetical protein
LYRNFGFASHATRPLSSIANSSSDDDDDDDDDEYDDDEPSSSESSVVDESPDSDDDPGELSSSLTLFDMSGFATNSTE